MSITYDGRAEFVYYSLEYDLLFINKGYVALDLEDEGLYYIGEL